MRLVLPISLLFTLAALPLSGSLLTFEGLQDLQSVAGFYSGVTFSNAVAEIAGFSLNDAEVPPVSGVTVALNDGGPITIDWDMPVDRFRGFFTHTAPLTLQFFLGGTLKGTAVSSFGNNLALSGDPGSRPNEAISFFAGDFDSVKILSDGQYGVDDLSFETGVTQPTPEPSLRLFGGALLACFCVMARYSRRGRNA